MIIVYKTSAALNISYQNNQRALLQFSILRKHEVRSHSSVCVRLRLTGWMQQLVVGLD